MAVLERLCVRKSTEGSNPSPSAINMRFIIYFLVLFGAYSVGRIGHILGGHLKAPHHWIYGMLALVVGIVLHSKWFGIYLILFGIGHIISDLKDMIELKFYGVDDVEVKKFWGID